MKLASVVNRLLLFAIPLATLNGCAHILQSKYLTTIGDYEIGREADGSCYVEDNRLPEEGDYFLRFTDKAFPENEIPYIMRLLERCEDGEFDPVIPEPIMDRF